MNSTGTVGRPASGDKVADLAQGVAELPRLAAEVELGQHVGPVARPPLVARRTQRVADAGGQAVHVAFRDQRVPGWDDLRYGTAAGPDHGKARGHALHQHEAELLFPL